MRLVNDVNFAFTFGVQVFVPIRGFEIQNLFPKMKNETENFEFGFGARCQNDSQLKRFVTFFEPH